MANSSAAVVLAAVFAAPAQASNDLASNDLGALLDLEVSGASKLALRISESPSSATVITAEQMRALGHRTLADVLRSVRALMVSSDRTYTYLGVRGFSAPGDYNTRVLVLIDGNRVNDTVYDQGFLGSEFPLDLDLVERVEFIPGPGSAVHGGNALFGTVNVVTRRASAAAGTEVAASVGEGLMRQLRVSASRQFGADASLLVSATTSRAAGTDAAYPVGVTHRTDHERGNKLFAKAEFGELSATLIHGDRVKGLSAYPDTVFDDPASKLRDTQTLADLTWQHRLDALSRSTLRLYGGAYSFIGDYLVEGSTPVLNRDTAESRWWGVEGNLVTERWDAHKLVVGGELQYSPRRDQGNADIAPMPAVYLDDRHRTRRHALFAEDQWTLLPALSATLGLRYDAIDGMKGQWSPRLAVVGRPTNDLVLKYIHGDAFRPPNAYELYYAAVGSYKGNAALHSERLTADEFVLELRPTPTSRWTLSAYSNRLHDPLVQNVDPADGLLVFRNVGALHAHGVEIEAEQSFHNGAQLRVGASVHDLHDESGQALDLRNAQHLAKIVAIAPLPKRWTLGSETVLVAHRGGVPGYGITNLTLSRRTRGGAQLSASIYNLFDRRALDPGGDSALQSAAPQDRRSLGLRLQFDF